MALPNTIERLSERNTPGACKLQFIRVEDIEVFPNEVRGTIESDIVPKTGKNFITVKPTRMTQDFREEWVTEGGSQLARASLSFVVSKVRPGLTNNFWRLKPGRYVVLHHDLNGTVTVMGTKNEPAQLTNKKLQHGVGGDRNAYELFVGVTRRTQCPFYGVTPPAEEPNGNLAEQIAAVNWATIEGYLNEGQIADAIASLCETCPTLAQLIPPATWATIEGYLSSGQLDDARASICSTLCELIDQAFLAEGGELIMDVDGNADTFPVSGTTNGRPHYTNAAWGAFVNYAEAYWNGSGWYVTDGVSVWTSTDDVATVDLITNWSGSAPYPTFTGGNNGAQTIADCIPPEHVAALIEALGGAGSSDPGTVKTTDGTTTVLTVDPGATENLPQVVIKYRNTANASVLTTAENIEFAGGTLRPATEIARRTLRNSEGTGYNFVTLANMLADTLPAAPDANYQRKDSAGGNIGTLTPVPAGNTVDVTCPDGTIQRQNSAGTNIGSPISVRSNESGLAVICPDGTVTVRNLNGDTLGSSTVRSNGTANYTAPIPLKFVYALGEDTSTTWTVTADEAGTYGTYTNDGSSGTITYSKNGGAFTSLSGSISLAVGDTIAVRRTTFNAAGWVRWAP